MNGAGKKVWGYYPAGDVWLPLQVDANGKVVVDMSGINLGDLGDVRVPAPGDQNFLYWDATSGKWTYRILLDADIPAGIARDAEVAAAVADEATARDAAIAAVELDDLADVNVPAPADGEALIWDDATSKWIPGAVGVADISCKAMHYSHQSIPDNAATILAFDHELFDTDNIHDNVTNNSRLTCKTAGKYQVTGQVYYATNAVGVRQMQILKNGSIATPYGWNSVPAVSGVGTAFNISVLIELAVNDYLELITIQNSGGALNVLGAGWYTPIFSMVKVG